MLVICCTHACHMLYPCLSSVVPMFVICCTHACHSLYPCWSSVVPMLVIRCTHSRHLLYPCLSSVLVICCTQACHLLYPSLSSVVPMLAIRCTHSRHLLYPCLSFVVVQDVPHPSRPTRERQQITSVGIADRTPSLPNEAMTRMVCYTFTKNQQLPIRESSLTLKQSAVFTLSWRGSRGLTEWHEVSIFPFRTRSTAPRLFQPACLFPPSTFTVLAFASFFLFTSVCFCEEMRIVDFPVSNPRGWQNHSSWVSVEKRQ